MRRRREAAAASSSPGTTAIAGPKRIKLSTLVAKRIKLSTSIAEGRPPVCSASPRQRTQPPLPRQIAPPCHHLADLGRAGWHPVRQQGYRDALQGRPRRDVAMQAQYDRGYADGEIMVEDAKLMGFSLPRTADPR
jgi:hypothetical protein